MNIAFISYWSCPLTRLGILASGGMNVYVLNLANNLGALGHTVDIYARKHKESDEVIVKTHKNVRIIHLKSSGENHYKNVNPFAARVLGFIKQNSLSYDILHSHYFYSGLVGIRIKEKLSVPLFMTYHALGVMKDLYSGIKDKKRIEAEIKIANSADAIVSSMELEKEELVKRYKADKSKIFILPPGVNHHIFKNYEKVFARKKVGMPLRQKVILFVGRIDPIKGITLLIEAVNKLVQKYENFKNNFRVILIGGDIESYYFWRHKEVIKIQSLIEKLDLACCIKFIGAKPHYLLPYYYAGSDIVVAPSKYESFGLVLLEAMASGASVIASKVGGHSYLIRDKINGRFFRSGDAEELSKIIWELLNNDRRRERLGKAAILESLKYCWDIQAKKMLDVYQKFTKYG